jgi:hypothetical protein
VLSKPPAVIELTLPSERSSGFEYGFRTAVWLVGVV